MHICKFCSREYEKILSVRNHERSCNENPNRLKCHFSEYNKIPKDRKDQGIRLSQKYKLGELTAHRTPHTEKSKQRLSEVAKKRKLGGYVKGSGRGKKGWYKGFFCDSSYELAYLIYCLDHQIDIKRNIEKRQYIWEGKTRNYIPDFIVNSELVEIKGFRTEQWNAKIDANPDIKVLYKKDLHDVFQYVISRYGKDYIQLYE